MFDLDQAIAQWQHEIASAGPMSGAELDELAEHLKEQVAELQETGLSVEDSFLVASHRLGDVRELSDELMHANPTRKWVHRLLVGFIALMALLGAASIFATAIWIVDGGWPQVRENLKAFGHSMLLDWRNLALLLSCVLLALTNYRLLICRLFPSYRRTFILAMLAMIAGQWAYEIAMIGSAPCDPSFSPKPDERPTQALLLSLLMLATLAGSIPLRIWIIQRRSQTT